MTMTTGSGTDETLTGSPDDDTISGGGGDDVLYSGNGDDSLFGGDGIDRLYAGFGIDLLAGGPGDDRLSAGNGNDILAGGADNDLLSGGPGDDSLKGANGDDWLWGGADNDRIDGGQGNDRVSGWFGDDVLAGGEGNDIVHGDVGNDMVFGGNGDDWLAGGPDGGLLTVSLSPVTFTVDASFPEWAPLGLSDAGYAPFQVNLTDIETPGDMVFASWQGGDLPPLFRPVGRLEDGDLILKVLVDTDTPTATLEIAADGGTPLSLQVSDNSVVVVNLGQVASLGSLEVDLIDNTPSSLLVGGLDVQFPTVIDTAIVTAGGLGVDAFAAGDTLTGGDGADHLLFGMGQGVDVMTDFDPGEDAIRLLPDLVGAEVTKLAYDDGQGAGTLLLFGDGSGGLLQDTGIFLRGVDPSEDITIA